jgi:hypothetical protein
VKGTGTDVMILEKNFGQKNLARNWRSFFKQLKVFLQNDHNIYFLEKRQFFRLKLAKRRKIVIITSTPRLFGTNDDHLM